METSTKVEKVQAEALSLFKRKNEQYGNAFAKYGTVGVMIRMGEKINRFLSVNRLNRTKGRRNAKGCFVGFAKLFLHGYNVIG